MSLDLPQLRTFLEAARAGSYTRAAGRLHVSQSAVSHAMRKLEDQLGLQLVRWEGRQLLLTEEGRVLHQAAERVFADLDRVEQRLAEASQPTTRVLMGAPVEFGTSFLLPRLGPFLRAHPELHVDLRFSHHLVQPLLEGELDLAVDCVEHTDPGVISAPLFREDYAVVASPELLARHPLPSPLHLEAVTVLSLDREGGWWDRVRAALEPGQRPVLARVVGISHVRGLVTAAVHGLGVGLVPRYTVLGELESGALVALFEDLPLLADRFSVVQLGARSERPVNQALTEWLMGLDAGELEPMARP